MTSSSQFKNFERVQIRDILRSGLTLEIMNESEEHKLRNCIRKLDWKGVTYLL